ncbi:TonB-linked outer membrane protein [Coprobacter fastidiosus NSB1 = JCM 33896]|jgi:TonB-linked SusC/RagA family outer membrane protein|uniref:TonB-linked SusC/RagA family outer membrane protein n=3 Tax=Barnesiellaceae TaxID=2005519 RepID=A0A495WC63_9BACT|nr:TonB-linked outer membrane protein [Coprobacter fastidiosus NSB1 = JCM 33896]RKT58363.1 TonB-linked SusC/RagA family outer membrane protein [Coprobacter fastidiosus NSB1 = JCM 33896]
MKSGTERIVRIVGCLMAFFNFLLLVQPINAQTSGKVSVKGVVLDEAGETLPGATVTEKGTKNVAATDLDGKFTIKVSKSGATLIVSYVGYVTKEVTSKPDMKVILSENSKNLDEVVVVGYGTMKKRDVTGAISSISSKDIEQKMATNVFEALQGQTAGIQIISGSGQPGETSSIKIRGTSTFSADGVKPLYIVDGIPLDDIDGINPTDIASMEILKDAASAAIYGSRSANGVIIITTKQGEAGKPRIDVKYNHSWGTLSHKLAQANRADRRYYDNARRQYFLDNNIGNADESIQMIQDSLNVFFNVDNDYQDMILQTAQKDQVDISVGGGSDKIKYFINTGYFNERGIVPNTAFQRLTTRINSDYKPVKWMNMGSRIALTYSKKEGINENALLNAMLSRRPYFSTYYPDGSLVGVFNGQKNPIAQVEYTTDFTDAYKGNFYQFFEFDIYKGLKFRTNINANFSLSKRKKLYPSIITDEWQKSNEGGSYNYLGWNWMNEDYFSYSHKWGDHNFSAMAGFSAQRWSNQNEILVGTNSSTDYIYTMNAFASNLTQTSTGTWQTSHSLASLFARITYDYKGRYLLTANVRRDGSSRFAENNKWGNFPSASVGWRISDEKFMQFAKPALDDAKIRVSYGVTGNESIGNYDYVYTYSPSTIYDGVGGVSATRIGKDNLKWEETKQFDIGLDLSFWNSRLTATFDYYDKYTSGLLADYELPKESGFSTMKTNVGEVSNRGFEVAIAGDIIRTKNFRWNASFNISRNINQIERLSEGKAYLEGDLWWMQEGGRIGDFYGYKYINVFQYDESNAFAEGSWQQLTPVFENGVFQNKYLLNGTEYTGKVLQKTLPNGKPFRGGDINWEEPEGSRDGIIDDNDRMIIGNALPDVTGGLSTQFTYKDWSLFISFYYSLGGEIYNFGEHNRNMFKYTGTTPSPDVIYNTWLKQGDIALYPRPYNDEYDNARYANSFYVEDGSFIRLQNVRLSYNLPKNWCRKCGVKGINLYAFVNNALTWTKYSGFDPEFSTSDPLQIGRDNYRYPKKREYGVGMSVNF